MRDLEVTEPADRLYGHFIGSSEWRVADLPQLIGGLYYIPAYSELWLIRITIGDQLRRALTLYLKDALRSGVTPSWILVRAVARLVGALIMPPEGAGHEHRFCQLRDHDLASPDFWKAHSANA